MGMGRKNERNLIETIPNGLVVVLQEGVQVGTDRSREQDWILWDDAQFGSQVVETYKKR